MSGTASPRKDRLDGAGLASLLAVQMLLAFNQIIVAFVNKGLQPVFFAGLRSALAVIFVWALLRWRGRPVRLDPSARAAGLMIGAFFAAEFLLLFLALDLTTVGRASILMYSMPVWFALMAHFGLGERITPRKAVGLAIAFAGTAWAILGAAGGAGAGQGSLAGDLCALGAGIGWAATAYVARRPAMRAQGPELQLFWMVLVSAPILLAVSPLFGPLVRELQPLHMVGLIFQSTVVVAGGFIAWLWLMSVYPASTVAAFSFLSPVFAILMGAVFLGESLSPAILGPAALVALGIVLINRAAVAQQR
ncbi:MAG: DMT family transporter [Paracoccaceae bacterium]